MEEDTAGEDNIEFKKYNMKKNKEKLIIILDDL